MSDNLIDWLRWLSRLSIVQVNHTSNARRANRYFAALCIGSDAPSSVAAGVNNQFCGDSSLPALVRAASATVRTIGVAKWYRVRNIRSAEDSQAGDQLRK
jgi:hypothetical protein